MKISQSYTVLYTEEHRETIQTYMSLYALYGSKNLCATPCLLCALCAITLFLLILKNLSAAKASSSIGLRLLIVFYKKAWRGSANKYYFCGT